MKLGFICINLPDHLKPDDYLAHQLQARGREVGSDGLSELICRQVFLAQRAFSVYPRHAHRVRRRQKQHPSGPIASELNFLM
jgi:hypothetical protein